MQPAKSPFHPANNKHLVIQEACIALANGNLEKAKGIITTKYPFEPTPKGQTHWPMAKPKDLNYSKDEVKRNVTERKKIEVWRRDGFTDLYTGQKVVYPGVFKLLTEKMPEEFPLGSPNWPMDRTHIAYYDLWASVDHVKPIARGGDNELSNLVTSSYCNNKTKNEYLLDEINAQLLPPGDLEEWDGLLGWYNEYLNSK